MSRTMTNTHHAIDYVELSVSDLTSTRAFYEQAFGWQFNDYGPAYAGIRAPSGDGEVGAEDGKLAEFLGEGHPGDQVLHLRSRRAHRHQGGGGGDQREGSAAVGQRRALRRRVDFNAIVDYDAGELEAVQWAA